VLVNKSSQWAKGQISKSKRAKEGYSKLLVSIIEVEEKRLNRSSAFPKDWKGRLIKC